MSELLHKSHNVTVLPHHLVCVAKYRHIVVDLSVNKTLRDICLDIGQRYDLVFLEIGTDKDHVHFLIQSIPTYSPSRLVQMIKSLTAREMFHRLPDIKKQLWGGEFWSDGYFMSTVGQHSTEAAIRHDARNQGTEKAYQRLHH
jgi:REP element-mobilizing transposase RayT